MFYPIVFYMNNKKALIYKPSKTAMQSGKAKTDNWVLEYQPESRKIVENLMGWQGSEDMNQEVRLAFNTKEEAISYAEKKNIHFEIVEPHERKIKQQSYADNFVA